ncbi:DNA/RNA non-specific endonuclease [Streptomyces sp. SAJ15]|uniref:DNA/RNA non-specific endonuclease n=1 Tax=Streptomyces sp. SAJ15 TaxID=2011095 RepID=UPI0028CB243F|nr:DNA/RNA non-specific endonuclease [Streptomyces sp. SAJ15]
MAIGGARLRVRTGTAAGASTPACRTGIRRATSCTRTTPWTADTWCADWTRCGESRARRKADDDTFHYTNAAPQADIFNQGKELWLGLEAYLLEHAAEFDRRLVVHTGPVLLDSDPVHRWVKIPLRFWKVVGFLDDGQLAATAYILDQSPDLTAAEAARALAKAEGNPPPLGAFRTFQAPVHDIATLTRLDFGPLPAADRMPTPSAAARGTERWTPLTSAPTNTAQPPPASPSSTTA